MPELTVARWEDGSELRKVRRSLSLLITAVAGLTLGAAPAQGTFAGSNGKLAFSSFRDGNEEVYTINPDGTELARLTHSPERDGGPVWSPDGLKLAFLCRRDDNWEICTVNSDGGGEVNLTQNPGYDAEPTWSPDGSKIAFTSDRDCGCHEDAGLGQIYVMNADGSDPTRVTFDAPTDVEPNWSPDGRRIAFEREAEYRGTSDIFSVGVDGTDPINLTNNPGDDDDPRWSPDGSRIVFSSCCRETYLRSIWSVDPEGIEQHRLTSGQDGLASWSPDGAKLVFVGTPEFTDEELFTMNPDGSGQSRLTNNFVDETAPNWSPDGARLSFLRPSSDRYELYVMNADGSGVARVLDDPSVLSAADWQPIPSRPPDCSAVTATPNVIQAASPEFRLVSLAGAIDPDGDTVALTVTGVTQDEPLTGGEDRTSPDAYSKQLTTNPALAALLDNRPNEVYLRAERRNSGDGRVYQTAFSGSDGKGGTCSGSVKVSVPRKAGLPAVDSAPPSFDSLGL